jgi:fatty-acyl-CoA synthase
MKLIHPHERRKKLDAAHGPWQPRSLAQHLAYSARRFPDREFVVTDGRTCTYADMDAWATRLASGLAEMGVRPGEHVAMVMANHPEFVAMKFAIARAGAVCVPVNFLLRERELSYVLAQSRSVALITMDRFRQTNYVAMLDEIMPGWETGDAGDAFPVLRDVVVFRAESLDPTGQERPWRTIDDLETMGTERSMEALRHLDARVQVTDTCDVLYTSGTTGSPKGVMLTHDMIVRTGYASAYCRALPTGHRVAYSLPMYHVFGYIECLLAVTFAGGAVVPRLIFDPVDMLQCVALHSVNEIACVPTMTLGLLAEARTRSYDLSTINIVYSSGGPAPAGIWDEIRQEFEPDELVTGYGQTETTAAMTSTLPESSDDHLRRSHGRFRDAGVAGDPALGGVLAVYKAVDVVTGVDLPRGASGELLVRGPAVTAGYYDKPEETADAFTADGWLRTGDLGSVDDDDYVLLVGRLKETYRCGGEMVMPKEIELLLADHPGVEQVHVVGVPHARMGEVGCAVIVAAPGAELTHDEIIELCARELARFKIPAHVVFMDAADLPLTVTGRVRKFRLAEMIASRLPHPLA